VRLLRLVRLSRLSLRLSLRSPRGKCGYGLNIEAFLAGCWFGIVIVLIVIVLPQVIFLRVFLFVFEVFVLPDIFAEQGFVDAARVDDDLGFVERLEVGAAEIKRRGLESVEHEAGSFGVELAGEHKAHDLHETDLDGVRVLEDGEVEGGAGAAGAGGVDDDALIVPLLVKVAEAVAAQRGRFALRAIGFDVLAARNVGTIHGGIPLPLIYWNDGDSALESKKERWLRLKKERTASLFGRRW
jgi:hypothetical protein